VTGMRLRHLELTPNFALRVAVQARYAARTSRMLCLTFSSKYTKLVLL